MANEQLMKKYSSSIRNIKKQSVEAGMTEEDFKKMYFESLEMVMKEKCIPLRNNRRFIYKHKFKIILYSILLISFLYNIKTIYNSLLCNLQEYIYPGLRVLRHLSIPFISLFPSLTELYHETCLIQNPFFTVHDMDCWPCSAISNVIEIHDPKPIMGQQNAPFIYETNQLPIRINDLKDLYETHKETLDKASTKVLINNKYHSTLMEVFGNVMLGKDKSLYVWKSNNMNVARILRKIIPRPKVVPKFGQSTERFIIIDSSQKYFRIPDTECSYSFLMVLSGSRVVDLRPAEECKHQCKSLEVELKETYLLWYNWWYWRPVIQPSYYGNDTLIAHVGSYC